MHYNIIAIQEPWLNPAIQSTYCPANCQYTVLFPPTGRAPTCFYINKAIPVSSWSHAQSKLTPDYCQLTIRTPTGKLTIDNLYSPSPLTPTTTEWSSPIPDMLIPNVMLQGGEHLVVGDFNLHHPLWGGTAVERSDVGALQIVETIEAGTLQLLSVPGVPTREKHGNQSSTLDLTLATPSTAARIAACEVNNDILGSDHLPITTTFLPSMALCAKSELRRSFKKLDTERVAQGAQEIQTSLLSNPLSTIGDIDHHCKQLTSSIQNLISGTVPLAKNTSYAQPWWNNDITAAI